MDCRLYLLACVGILCISYFTPADGKKKYFTYTINNQLEEPFFTESINLTWVNKRRLVDYMGDAVVKDPQRFINFTATFNNIFKGFFINAINGQWGYWVPNQTWWSIWNGTGLIPLGVSKYIPAAYDPILFNFTKGWINH